MNSAKTHKDVPKGNQRKLRVGLYVGFLLIGLLSMLNMFGLIIFFAFIPIIRYIKAIPSIQQKTVIKDFYFGGVIIGVCAFSFVLQIVPQNWTTILMGWASYLTRGATLIVLAIVSSFGFALLGLLLKKISSFNSRVLCLIVCWPIAEIIRSYLAAIAGYGPGASISPNYNFGSLAVIVSGTPLVYLSRFVGFFGLTIITVAIAVALYYIFFEKVYLLPASFLVLLFAINLYGWNIGNRPYSHEINVSTVQLGENSKLKEWSGLDRPPSETDLLVLPEYSEFLNNKSKEDVLSTLSNDGIAITSVSNGESPSGTNQLQIVNQSGVVVDKQDKTFLIPTGEYLPYAMQAFLKIVGQKSTIEGFTLMQQITPGSTPPRPFKNSAFTVGAIACSGITSLNEYRQLSHQGSDVLTNSASLAFLSSSSLYHGYAKNMARFHTVSNTKPLVQSSRGGESFIMNKQGRILVSTKENKNVLLSAKLGIQ